VFHVLFAELTDLLPFPVMPCSWIVSQVTSVSWRLWAPTVASHFQVMHMSMFVSIIMLISMLSISRMMTVSLVSREAKEHFCVDYFTIVLKVHWLYAGFWEHPQRRSGQESTSSETGMSIHTGNHKVFHELCQTWIHRVLTSFLYVHLRSFLYACKT